MWHPDRAKLVKVRLHARGEHGETPWAEDCGPAPGSPGARFVRLANVPFLHAKPTYGDVIVARPDERGVLSWDTEDLTYEEVRARLIEDEGRWVLILDYEVTDPSLAAQEAFDALDVAAEEADIAAEGCYAPNESRPGRAYLAVPGEMEVDEVLAYLVGRRLPLSLTLVHPLEDEGEDAGRYPP
jgi:hypothetical protein